MDKMSAGDYRAVLECAHKLYGHHDFETFPRFLIEALPEALKGEYVAHTEVDPTGGWAPRAVMVPEVEDMEGLGRRMLPVVRQHPVIMYCQETGDGTAHQISDFITREEYHKLPLYQEFYRPMGVEDQLSIMLPAPTGTVIGLSISRDIWRFSERERGILNALRPHLLQAYRNAAMRTQLERALGQVQGAMEEMPVGVVILDGQFQSKLVTKPAERLFLSYFSTTFSGVPGEILEYARGVMARGAGEIPTPLTVRRERSYLVVQPVRTGCRGR